MGFISNKLVELTESAMKELVTDDMTEDNIETLFYNIQDFILNNGDMINDTPAVIAEAYKKNNYGRRSNKKTKLIYPIMESK